jgi:benzoyl-CoA reductase/2-hydroxyglutaryl-CoA dehydratase subunit BcrC/BadD/HgdB
MSMGNISLKKAVRSTNTAQSVNEILMKWYAKSMQAGMEGRQVAWCMVGVPMEIINLFGIAVSWPENYGTACAARQAAVHFMEIAESEGYSKDLCSYERNALGYCKELIDAGGIPEGAPQGGMPWPSMLITNSYLCDPRSKGFQAFNTRYMKGIPMYIMDCQATPFGVNMNDPRIKEHYRKHNMQQYKGLIEFLEKQTGKKLDEAALSVTLKNTLAMQRLIHEVHELRKAVPSPMPSEDQFACIVPQLYMGGSEDAVSFYSALRDEVQMREKNKVGVIPDEKLRILWVGIPPWFNIGIFNYLETLGAVSVMETTYYMGTPIEVDVSDPMEALFEISWRKMMQTQELGAELTTEGTIPAALVIKFIRDYRIDGVIFHRVLSCRAISFGQAHTARRLREELPIPILFLESDMADPRAWSDAYIKNHIYNFLETIEMKK